MVIAVLVLMVTGLPAAAGSDLLDSDDLLVTTIPNDFYPAEAELSDCLSALPPPGCGSEAKGGWPQFAAMAFIVVGIGAIAARVLWSVRRARRASARGPSDGDPGHRAGISTGDQPADRIGASTGDQPDDHVGR